MSRRLVNLGLYALTLAVAAAGVVLAVTSVRAEEPALPAEGDPDLYAAVLEAAEEQAEAFVNVRYDDVDASIDAVLDGATGEFEEQYESSTSSVRRVLRQNRSVQEGEVVWAGVVDADAESAVVIVATQGTLANKATDDQPVARSFRLRLQLTLVEDRWLTDDLQFVG